MVQAIRHEIFGIQILRGIAAIAVVIHHAFEMSNGSVGRFSPNWLTTSGAVGVDIFFVISGFIMMHTAAKPGREPITPLLFLKKRMARIYPFYWICLAGMMLLFGLGFMAGHDISASKVVLSALLFPGDPLIGVSWTLSYEMFFYLIFAAALVSRSRAITGALAILSMLSALSAGAVWEMQFLANPIIIEFCFGVALALIAERGSGHTSLFVWGLLAWVCAILAPIVVPAQSTAGLEGWSRVVAWGIPATIIVAASLSAERPASRFGRLALLIGDASYSIYLTHVFGMIAYGWLIKKTMIGSLHQGPFVAIVTAICVLAGVLAHLWIEVPVNRVIKGEPPFRPRRLQQA